MPAACKYHTNKIKPLISKRIITIFLLSAILISCRRSGNNNITDALTESLAVSNNAVRMSNQQILHSLRDKANDPMYAGKAAQWLAKAEQAENYSSDMLQLIETISQSTHISRQVASNLFTEIRRYQSAMLGIDTIATIDCRKKIIFFSKELDSTDVTQKEFIKHFFGNTSDIEARSMLEIFSNNILVTENTFLTHFHNRGEYDKIIIEEFSLPLIGQSSTVLQPGEKLNITAGIGVFSLRDSVAIEVKGKPVRFNDEGFVRYTTTAPATPGKHYIPIKFSYIDKATGEKNVLEKNIEYTVAKPCSQ